MNLVSISTNFAKHRGEKMTMNMKYLMILPAVLGTIAISSLNLNALNSRNLIVNENKLESELSQDIDSDNYTDHSLGWIMKPGIIAERGSNKILKRSLENWRLRDPVRF